MILRHDGARAARLTEGHNSLSGSTAIAGDPDTSAPGRSVQLLRSVRLPHFIAGVVSDTAGQYAFEHIRHRPASDGYTVIAYDHTGVYDPVAKTNLVPSPMPPDPAEHL